MDGLHHISDQVRSIAEQLAVQAKLGPGKLLVIGTSTSEVMGKHIGTAGATDVAEQIYRGLADVQKDCGFDLAFQCCEHLNRALVVSRQTLERYRLEEVAAIPVPKAGGSMASYAYRHMEDACLVEQVQADAGIDIGLTLIGMHLKRVAVPFRPKVRQIGEALVSAAYTRPKLIGGERAVYRLEKTASEESGNCS
ncbi:TIGR01440 family protein [Marinicrinis lubricantis]|uniref:UPF0340 protein ACFPXP_03510 n=1 Tax=Marinicrinis lubricantis TaxID=2086470 RepID=A0ABW1IKB4_9BACL